MAGRAQLDDARQGVRGRAPCSRLLLAIVGLDLDGCIWTAALYSREIRRPSPDGELIGVMGIQPVRDVALIRHAYVMPGQHDGAWGRR